MTPAAQQSAQPQPAQPAGNQSDAISFTTNVETKAVVEGDSDTYATGYSIFASAVNDESSCVPFNNTHLVRQNNAWTYAPPQYWSLTFRYNFLAMYPYKASGYGYTPAQNKVTVAATTSYSTNNQDDYMAGYAYREVNRNGAAPGTVRLDMKHLCASLVFNIKNTTSHTYADISSADLVGLISAGTCNITPKADKTGFVAEWTLSENRATSGFAGDKANTNVAPNATGTLYQSPIIVLPQTVTEDIELSLSLQVQNESAETKTAKLLSAKDSNHNQITKWEAGNRYIYNIEISDVAIKIYLFAVEDWDFEEAGTIYYSDQN